MPIAFGIDVEERQPQHDEHRLCNGSRQADLVLFIHHIRQVAWVPFLILLVIKFQVGGKILDDGKDQDNIPKRRHDSAKVLRQRIQDDLTDHRWDGLGIHKADDQPDDGQRVSTVKTILTIIQKVGKSCGPTRYRSD